MSVKAKILELFNELSEADRNSLLQELSLKTVSEKILVEDAPVISCPHCESKLFVKNGKRGDLQKFKCKSCCKIFTPRTGTPMHKIQKLDKFEAYKALMLDSYLPLKKIAAKVGVSIQTAFDWRHKILSGLNQETSKFEGVTEIDDIWFLYSQKGRKGLGYSRKRGGSKRAGDNEYQAKLLITSDRKSKTDLSLVRVGRIKKSDIQRKVSGRFSKDSTLVSDKHRSIASFAKSEGIEHVSFKASEHSAGGEFHVQNVNNMASRLKGVINHSLRGVATKYLQSYANWFKLNLVYAARTDGIVLNNKYSWDIHKNREGIYKRFIENFSNRTYRSPVKRTFLTELSPDMILKLQYL
jgi:transposase-like protein